MLAFGGCCVVVFFFRPCERIEKVESGLGLVEVRPDHCCFSLLNVLLELMAVAC